MNGLGNTWAVACLVGREMLYQRLFLVLLVVAIGVVASAGILQGVHFGSSEMQLLLDLGQAAIGVLGAALIVLLTAQQFCHETESAQAMTLLSRPVGRGAWTLGRILGLIGLVVVYCAVVGILLAALLWRQQVTLAMSATQVRFDWGDFCGMWVVQTGRLVLIVPVVAVVAGRCRTALLGTWLGAGWVLLAEVYAPLMGARLDGGAGEGALGGILRGLLPDLSRFSPEAVGAGNGGMLFFYGLAYGLAYTLVAIGLAYEREY